MVDESRRGSASVAEAAALPESSAEYADPMQRIAEVYRLARAGISRFPYGWNMQRGIAIPHRRPVARGRFHPWKRYAPNPPTDIYAQLRRRRLDREESLPEHLGTRLMAWRVAALRIDIPVW